MDERIKGMWVDALLSGQYKKGIHMLRSSEDEFCCLGVLCDLAVREGVIPQPVLREDHYRYEDDSAFLPKAVMEWAGVERNDAFRPPTDSIWHINDDTDTFDQVIRDIKDFA